MNCQEKRKPDRGEQDTGHLKGRGGTRRGEKGQGYSKERLVLCGGGLWTTLAEKGRRPGCFRSRLRRGEGQGLGTVLKKKGKMWARDGRAEGHRGKKNSWSPDSQRGQREGGPTWGGRKHTAVRRAHGKKRESACVVCNAKDGQRVHEKGKVKCGAKQHNHHVL